MSCVLALLENYPSILHKVPFSSSLKNTLLNLLGKKGRLSILYIVGLKLRDFPIFVLIEFYGRYTLFVEQIGY